jgi:type I restriction enzyme R subunit
LDYVENFVLYYQDNQKIIAQNHQFIGVNRAYETFLNREALQGKLGVFWHTQGSGKSFSMIFYVRKIFRKQTGNFTFVVVTDRDDLDGQIYRNFLHTGTVTTGAPKDGRRCANSWPEQTARLHDSEIRWPKGRPIHCSHRATTSS